MKLLQNVDAKTEIPPKRPQKRHETNEAYVTLGSNRPSNVRLE